VNMCLAEIRIAKGVAALGQRLRPESLEEHESSLHNRRSCHGDLPSIERSADEGLCR
jgi:hypothetical protein